MTVNDAQTTPDRGSLIVGTILSIPLLLAAFVVVATAYYFFHTFMAGAVGGGIPQLVEFSAAVLSSVIAIGAGRWLCDKALRAWSGWPFFVLLLALTLLNTAAILAGYHDGVWAAVLATAQLAAAAIASWFLLVKQVPMN